MALVHSAFPIEFLRKLSATWARALKNFRKLCPRPTEHWYEGRQILTLPGEQICPGPAVVI
jgi:hypothetical protein